MIMEEVDENQVVSQEAARNIGMRELMMTHGIIVQFDDFVN